MEVWPGSIAYLRNGIVTGYPVAVADGSFNFVEESLTLNVADLKAMYEDVCRHVKLAPVQELQGWWICLANWAHINYYHWFVQCLPNLLIVKELGPLENFRFLVPKLTSWQRASILAAGVPADRITEVGPGTYRCEHLLYPSDLRNQPEAVSSRFLALGRAIKSEIISQTTPEVHHRKIYVARLDSQSRLLKNEGEIIDHFRARGFGIIVCGGMEFRQQVLAFANAKYVVGAHGAGLINMTFCQEGTTLLELNPFADRKIFERIAHRLDLNYHSIVYADPQVSSDSLSPWRIDDVDSLLRRVEQLDGD